MHQLNDVPAGHQPFPFWFWNGEMTVVEVQRQIGIMHEAGITEFILHGRSGLVTPFLSEEWFAAVAGAIEEAARRGMRVWIYDEYNWPSGNAASRITADPAKREHVLTAEGVQPEMGWFGPLSVDYLNPACTEEFIDLCYAPYYQRFGRYFGNTVLGFFNDEVRFCNAYPWSPSISGPVPEGAEYHRQLGVLITRHYFQQLRDWCTAHRVELIGHVMGEETLGSQARYLRDSWSAIAAFHQPGVDHLGCSAQGHHPRLPASVAHLLGNLPVTSETFAGCPWDASITDLYRIAGWLYANGVTRLILHGFFYARDAEDWPPDLFFRWEGWTDMPAFIQWAGRVQYFLARAVPQSAVALYYPLQEFYTGYQPDAAYQLGYRDAARVEGETARRYHLAFGALMNALLARGIDFDIVPAHLLDTVADRILLVPGAAQPAFAGRVVRQGEQSVEACVEQVEALLGRRVRVSGPGATPNLRPVPDTISDPYLHDEGDDGGVWVKTFRFADRPAVLLWNANPAPFHGTCDLVEHRAWTQWTPADGQELPLGTCDTAEVSLAPYSMAMLLADG